MSKIQFILAAAAFALPLLSFNAAAQAATAHNLQSGAHTKNAYDSAATANLKQMRRHHRRY